MSLEKRLAQLERRAGVSDLDAQLDAAFSEWLKTLTDGEIQTLAACYDAQGRVIVSWQEHQRVIYEVIQAQEKRMAVNNVT